MKESIDVIVTESDFSIHKTRKTAIKEWGLFILYSLVIYFSVFLFYYYLRKHVKVEYFVLFSVAFFVFYIMMNRKKLKTKVVRINRIDGEFFIGSSSFNISDKKIIVLYEFSGELYINAIGNLYLKVRKNEYPLYYGATHEQVSYIKDKLEMFFSEQIEIERKMLY